MSDTLTLTGIVATVPRTITTAEGLAITSFRLASSQRRFDRTEQRWIDGDTNWYTITTFRQLATNSAVSVVKGQRILVLGRIRIRDWKSGDRTGTNIDVEADAIGHDLTWGTASFSRNISMSAVEHVVPEQLTGAVMPGDLGPHAFPLGGFSGSPNDGATGATVLEDRVDGENADREFAGEVTTPF